ncbi:Uma2 family endonuclease [Microcoleus sp. FACHB-831]|uniref:Uma2 family endonuclease n=1 Tax=Microcoleus sp. FACHB-831 TaxID=2692827 RepID=UPI00168545AF|nr:Uma2 family endonuclease [Microcoleus sp. FACHB-831]MBD1921180.1 Uma2 family endonuclease [Microcoleus sp. FACHB-831]
MSKLQAKLPTDEWVVATWEEYIQALDNPAYERAKGYYHNGQLRIEMTPQGYDHSYDNSLLGYAIQLFCAIKSIPISGLTNCTFRKTNEAEAQPDLAFYIGDNAEIIPPDTSIVNLDVYPPPDLVIEVAKTSLSDDIGGKRMLYERLGVCEYWVGNVRQATLIAFAIADGGSKRIAQSQVLAELPFNLLEEALQRSRETGRSQVYAWLISQMQAISR